MKKTLFIVLIVFLAGFSVKGQNWGEILNASASDRIIGDKFGESVSISGKYAIVGAINDDDNGEDAGAAYIFSNNGGSWEELSKLTSSDGAARDRFGCSVSIFGQYAIIGARGDDDNSDQSGSAYIFFNNNGSWEQQAKLTASDGRYSDSFGYSVSIYGQYVIIGAERDDTENGSDSGSAYIFYNNAGNWELQAKLLAPDGDVSDLFGRYVCISEKYAIVGMMLDADNGTRTGSAYVFTNNGGSWDMQTKLMPFDASSQKLFGCSVSISGEYAVVGTTSNSAYIFHNNSGNWEQKKKLTAPDGAEENYFGMSVSISSQHIIIGAKYDDDNGDMSGAAYIFHNNSGNWEHKAKIIASDGNANNYFGNSVCISGQSVIIGAPASNITTSYKYGSAYFFTNKGVSGKIFNDININCFEDNNETGLANRKLFIKPINTLLETNSSGSWYLGNLPAGNYSITADISGKWQPTCPTVQDFIVYPDGFTKAPSFGFVSTEPCPEPNISIEMPRMRPCFTDQIIYVQACNERTGTGTLENAYAEVELDSLFTLASSEITYTELGNNKYSFDLGTLNPGHCERFWIKADLSCDAVLGQTLCMQADLFPQADCVFDTIPAPDNGGVQHCPYAWDYSSLNVKGACVNDTIHFYVDNFGLDMVCYTAIRVYIDGVLAIQDSVQLSSGEQRIFSYSGDGRTWRLEADQHRLHPGNSQPNASVERCGNSENWTAGKMSSLPNDDADPIVDIYCGEVTGSYDPNDKAGTPTGVGADNSILPNGKIEYRIRFQNTGTDTAFTVVIRDTLSTDLDIFTVKSGASSHNYSFRMYGPRILEWTFDNILLPDSFINEPLSNGFISFSVNQVPNLPDGTKITNNAGIYFDYNEPVITNTTNHNIDRNINTPAWDNEITISESECAEFVYNGITYNNTGTYYQVINNSVNSLVTLDIKIQNTYADINVTGGGGEYTAPDGQVYTESGDYIAIIPNSVGCDSIITIHFTIPEREGSLKDVILFYPNPTEDGNITVDLGKKYENIEYSVSDSKGGMIKKGKVNEKQLFLVNFNAIAGTYFLTVKTEGQKAVLKIIKTL